MRLKLRKQLFPTEEKSDNCRAWRYTVDSSEKENKDLQSVYESFGLTCVVTIFKMFGCQLLTCQVNWWLMGVAWMTNCIILLDTGARFRMLILNFASQPVEISCLQLVPICICLGVILQYFYFCVHMPTFCQQFNHFLSTLRGLDPPTTSHGKNLPFAIVGYVVFSLALTLSDIRTDYSWLEWSLLAVEVIWILLVSSCVATFTFILLFLNHTLKRFTNDYLPSADSVGEHQLRHQRSSELVSVVSSVYSNFLILSLVMELSLVMLFIRVITAYHLPEYIPTILRSVVQLSFFVAKNVSSASLNEKVKLLSIYQVKPTPIHQLKLCSTDQISYIMYLSLLQSCSTELTYGRIFPVRRAFILSVAGTAFTYAMIFRSMESP